MYGTAIHAALDHYFARKIEGDKLSLDQLLTDFRQAFNNVGFITREQEELRFRQGMDTLARFFDDDQKDRAIPSKVEEVFEFQVGSVKINGRFDLVYRNGKSTEIRDFKTSDVREQKEADRRIKSSTQMMIYALAWKSKYDVTPKTTLHFIESGKMGEITFSDVDLEKTSAMIGEVEKGIREKKLAATPEAFTCRLCPYRDICAEAI